MSERAPSILIVDDEDMVLTSLRSVFALQTDYQVHQAGDAKSALGTMSRVAVDLVISDFLMPEMNGIEFLKEARKLQPDSVRILLTGYADKENAIKAINEVGLYHYLEKPWDNDALLNIVKNGIQEKGLRKMLAEKIRELDSLMDRHVALERELEMAARVQESLLPREFPSLDDYRFANLYRPSATIGGDFYDFHAKGDSLLLLVSDVIGHGVRAALSTMLLKGVFQEAAASAGDPVALVEDMNRRLHAILPRGMYAAAAAFAIRSGSSEIAYANAGLPYPFVLRKSGRLDEIVLPGPPLGLFDGDALPFESRTIEAEPGDVLLVGSDGIGSIANPGGDLFEDTELRRVLSSLAGSDGETVIRETMRRALAFGVDGSLPDDVNLVAVTRIGSS
jgi:sigma-B regulation protein RsbU (phosphoserine phosphatase)